MLRSLTTECAHPSQRLLGDMGADVINVEPSGKGDRSRSAMDFRLKGNAFVVHAPSPFEVTNIRKALLCCAYIIHSGISSATATDSKLALPIFYNKSRY